MRLALKVVVWQLGLGTVMALAAPWVAGVLLRRMLAGSTRHETQQIARA